MATEERVMTLLVEANPVPDLDLLDLTSVDDTTYLAALSQRSSEMTQLKRRTPTVEARERRPLFLAVAAMVVVVFGIAVWYGFGRDENTVIADGMNVVNQFATAVSAGNTDLSGYLTDDATIGPITAPIDGDMASFWAGLDTDLSLTGCTEEQQLVTCDYRWTDAVRRAQDRPEFGKMMFAVQGSRVSGISIQVDIEASQWIEAGDPVIHYMDWLNIEHPGWELALDWKGEPQTPPFGYRPYGHDDPIRNANYANVLTRYIGDYETYLASSGGVSG